MAALPVHAAISNKYRAYVCRVRSTYAAYVAYVFDRIRTFTPNVEKRRKKAHFGLHSYVSYVQTKRT